MCYGQGGTRVVVATWSDMMTPLFHCPPSLFYCSHTAPKLCFFFTVAGDATDFDACLRFCFFESLLTCLHLQEFVSGGFVQNDGWLTLV